MIKMRKEIERYYESTKFNFDGETEFLQEFEWPITWTKIFYKAYPRFPSRKLEVAEEKELYDLESLLLARESTREFSNEPLTFEILSNLLFYSVGIKPESKNDLDSAKRMYPSAGGRYPIETYFVADTISILDKGLYHYNVKSNEIETLFKNDLSQQMVGIIGTDLYKASLVIILTGELSRTEVKYGTNAYRFALLEAGHIGQNISLLSEKYGLGCCAIGGVDNNKLVKLLDLTEGKLTPYMLAIGKKNG